MTQSNPKLKSPMINFTARYRFEDLEASLKHPRSNEIESETNKLLTCIWR